MISVEIALFVFAQGRDAGEITLNAGFCWAEPLFHFSSNIHRRSLLLVHLDFRTAERAIRRNKKNISDIMVAFLFVM